MSNNYPGIHWYKQESLQHADENQQHQTHITTMIKCIVKILPDSYILLLKQLYNSVMTTGKYPAIWTNSTIHPIFKNGYKNSPSNYRDLIEIYNNSDLTSVNLPECGDIHLLLYADDIEIIGESRMNLQKKIKILKEYLDENLMTLNESKSKIMVFRNGEAWTNSWISTDIPNKNLITSPNVKIPGFSLPRREWVLLNRFRTELAKYPFLINPRKANHVRVLGCWSSSAWCKLYLNDQKNLSFRFLTNEQNLCRLATCEDMFKMTRTDPEWKDKIITGDETWVYDYDPETKRQSAEWRGQELAKYAFLINQEKLTTDAFRAVGPHQRGASCTPTTKKIGHTRHPEKS
ncbi:hypothetical protein LAZ67_1007914 [Cordylochernes scorpioides]|uniref:Reverse transcriptase domain-containing protein n=1 Tax=Cordylochernes scorpioides TaxID=51811 RepID=A0ABY6JZP2_9ARAC|nr:hypothetical protein LAZ67_1007914 [Cordylochernes scorpioides]